MAGTAADQDPGERQNVRKGVSARITQVVVTLILQGGILFVASGRPNWISAWLYVAASAVGIVINGALLLKKDPEMVAERGRAGEGAKSWDKWLALLMSLLFPLLSLVVAGLDKRHGWSGNVPVWVHAAGLGGFLLGSSLWGWAMSSNPFFSGIVRIQRERDHSVARSGPYQVVRHPGYLGFAAMSIGTPLLLGSWWGLLPSAATLFTLITRTNLEDRTLCSELDGYGDYAINVRYRLLPGIW